MLDEKRASETDELKEAAKPLQEYLEKNWHIHCKAIVGIGEIEILESQTGAYTPENLSLKG